MLVSIVLIGGYAGAYSDPLIPHRPRTIDEKLHKLQRKYGLSLQLLQSVRDDPNVLYTALHDSHVEVKDRLAIIAHIRALPNTRIKGRATTHPTRNTSDCAATIREVPHLHPIARSVSSISDVLNNIR